MVSTVAYTDEIDDLEEAVREIFSQTEDFRFMENTLAIVMAEDEMDYLSFYKLLSEKWDFPVIGCTALAMIEGDVGYCGTGISVMLISADDCKFEVSITDALDNRNFLGMIRHSYEKTEAKMEDEVKLVIAFSVLVTGEEDVSGDDIVLTLDEVSGHKPVFGGLASDAFNFKESRIFYNENSVESGVVMALVSGNIKPRCVCLNSIDNKAKFSYEITESKRNQVFRLGSGSFIDAMRKASFQVEKTDVIGDYLLSPFVVTVTQPDGETVEVARNLSVLNHENGSGIFLGGMPEGSYLGIGLINREDVQKSVLRVLDDIVRIVRRDTEYEYSTFLCTTCAARFLALASDLKAEGEVCKKHVPEGISLLGMYAYGEFCPVTGQHTGKDYNMFHNFTFAMLAF